MSSGCGDVLSIEDLKTAKKHQTFEAEVITGKSGGIAGGADIDFATNPVTGQVQKTLPAIMIDVGVNIASFTFTTGGTLTTSDANKAVLWPIPDGGDGNYYLWKGSFPKTVPASSTPATSGGVSSSAWAPVTEAALRSDLASSLGASLVGAEGGGTVQDALDSISDGTYDLGYRSLTVKSRLDDHVSVKAFGAIGDGSTDDTTAIQTAADYAGTNKKVLYIPRGDYKITQPIVFTASAIVEGDGTPFYGGGTRILIGSANMVGLDFQYSENRVSNLLVVGYESDISVDSVNGYGQLTTCTGMRFKRSNLSKDLDSEVHGCWVVACNVGFYAAGANLKVKDCSTTACTYPIDLYSVSASPDDFRGFVLDDIRFHKSGGVYNTSSICIRATGTLKNSRIGNIFADAGNNRLYSGVLAEGAVIDGVIIRYMTGVAITVTNTGITPSVNYQTYSISNVMYQTPSTNLAQTGDYCIDLIDAPGGTVTNITTQFTRKGGVRLTRSPDVVIDDVNIRNMNVNYASDGATYDGVLITDNSTGVSVSNLKVRNYLNASQARSALYVDSTSLATVRNVSGTNVVNVFDGTGHIRGERFNSVTAPTTTYGTAIPTSGTYNQGSVMWNTSVTAGGVPGWVCITSGTPGAWRAMSSVAS